MSEDIEAMRRDAERYRWLCHNNFDCERMQVLTFQQWYEPHSQTGEPQVWSCRVRGGALDEVIDAAMLAESASPTPPTPRPN